MLIGIVESSDECETWYFFQSAKEFLAFQNFELVTMFFPVRKIQCLLKCLTHTNFLL